MHRSPFERHSCVFGRQQKTIKSLTNTATILSSRSSSVSASDSYTAQMCSLMSASAPASAFIDNYLKPTQRSCTEYQYLPIIVLHACFRGVERLGASSTSPVMQLLCHRAILSAHQCRTKQGISDPQLPDPLFCQIFVKQGG